MREQEPWLITRRSKKIKTHTVAALTWFGFKGRSYNEGCIILRLLGASVEMSGGRMNESELKLLAALPELGGHLHQPNVFVVNDLALLILSSSSSSSLSSSSSAAAACCERTPFLPFLSFLPYCFMRLSIAALSGLFARVAAAEKLL
jgi:hypothetical protein